MPTSVPGNSNSRCASGCAWSCACTFRGGPRLHSRGFTLIELMVVLALIVIAVSVVSLSLRDGDSDRLDNEAARLTALLESARAEARASGLDVRWLPTPDAQGRSFRFVGLPEGRKLPEVWLDDRVSAQVEGASALVLGPEAIIPAQRVRLRLDSAELVLATDGLAPFAVVSQVATETSP